MAWQVLVRRTDESETAWDRHLAWRRIPVVCLFASKLSTLSPSVQGWRSSADVFCVTLRRALSGGGVVGVKRVA
jgi:hypothetical protein